MKLKRFVGRSYQFSDGDGIKQQPVVAPPVLAKTKIPLQGMKSSVESAVARRGSIQNVSWAYFDRLRSSVASRSRSPDLVDAIAMDDRNGFEHEIMLRHIPTFFPLIVNGKIKQNAFDSTASVMLALYHFNSGIDVVTPQVASIVNERKCNVRFTTEFFDTGYSEVQASRELANKLIPRKYEDPPWDPNVPYATAIVGTFRSAVSATMSILGGVNELMQVSGSSTSAALDNKVQYPFFARTTTSSHASANVAVDYLADVLGLTHFGILYVRDVAGQSFADALKVAAAKKNPSLEVVSSSIAYKEDYTKDEIDGALRPLMDSGFRYFFVTIFPNQYRSIMPRAVELGIAGPGYFWMGACQLDQLSTVTYEANSKLVTALSGTGLICSSPASVQNGQASYEAFKQEWRERLLESSKALEHFVSKMPSTVKEFLDEVKFSENAPTSSMRHYDATMGLALAACVTQQEKGEFTPRDLYDTFVNMQFDGPLGKVVFDPSTGTRSYKTVTSSLQNIVLKSEIREDGKVTFDSISTHVFKNGKWIDNEAEFIYSDGTTVAPASLPPYQHNLNLIRTDVQALGFIFCGTAVVLSFAFLAWTGCNRNSGVVKKSQPFFLGMLCVGTMVMGFSIFTQGLQEPTNQSTLDKACMAFPWLFSLGFVISFSALFSKTRRINKIFHSKSYTRVKILPQDVLLPFLCLFLTNVSILVAWTVVSPLTYQRKESGRYDQYGRSLESYSHCYPANPSANDIVFMALSLAVNISVLVYANIEAYQARSIATEFQESQYIAICMATILEAAIMGAPIMILVQENPTARYLTLSSIIFIICLAMLLLIFLPKVQYLKNYLANEAKTAEEKRLRTLRQANLDAMMHEETAETTTVSEIDQISKHSGLAIVTDQRDLFDSSQARQELSRIKHEQLLLKEQNKILKVSLNQMRDSIIISDQDSTHFLSELPHAKYTTT